MLDIKDENLKDRAEKLSSAVYLVTSLIPDQEPIKWKLREKSLAFLSDMSRAVRPGPKGQQQIILPDSVNHTLEEILMLIDLALSSNLFSSMNFSLMRRGYETIKKVIEERSKEELSALPPPPVFINRPAISTDYTTKKTPNVASNVINKGSVASSNGRSESILSFIKSKGWASIKDIASSVPGVSSKTIQRELVSLVNNGILKKEGDRRWSRYNIAVR